MVMSLFEWMKRATCSHEFRLDELKKTGIAELETPKNNDYSEWMEYYSKIFKHESHTKRVMWPCSKCKKVFYAHCGLDILDHGKAI